MANQVANKEDLKSLFSFFKERSAAIADIMPKHMDAKRVVAVAIAAVQKNPALLNCNQDSMWACIRDASVLGLEVNMMGSCYLIPFKKECTLIIGYQGMIDLCRRSGHIESIEAHIIHEHDEFNVVYGTESKITHKPELFKDPGKLIAVYAVAKLKGGQVQTEVMTKVEIDKIMNRSRSGGGGPWKTDYDEMARKTVVRRIVKYLPKSTEMKDAVSLEDSYSNGEKPFMAATFDESQLQEATVKVVEDSAATLKGAAGKTNPQRGSRARTNPKKPTESKAPENVQQPAPTNDVPTEAPSYAQLFEIQGESPDSVQNAIAESAEQFTTECGNLKVFADIDKTDERQVGIVLMHIS